MRWPRLILLLGVVLAVSLAGTAQAAFPGVNGRIAFDRTLTSGIDQIFSVSADGTGTVNLSNDPSAFDSSPVYSRDGTLIAFRRSGIMDGPGGIWVMNADGSGKHQITSPASGVADFNPAFSPDGKQIVFERDPAADIEMLFVVNVNGTGEHQLLTPPSGSQDETPTWSPDGTKIAFMREPTDDSGGQIMTVSADGTGAVTPVSHPPTGYKDGDPNFSPDGSKIVFSRSQAVELNVPSNIIVVDVATTVETALTNDSASTIENEDPAFSPDGTQIMYGRADATPNTKQLYVMAADGSGKLAITPGVAMQFDGVPNWQPLQPPPVLSGFKVAPSRTSIAGRRVNGQCVASTANNKRHKRHKRCRRAAKLKVSYTLNTASSVAFTLMRSLPGRQVRGRCVTPTKAINKRKHCTLAMRVNVPIKGPGAAGANSFSLSTKPLAPGSYVLTGTPSAAGAVGPAKTASFTILS